MNPSGPSRHITRTLSRSLHTTPILLNTKVPVHLIASLRKTHPIPLSQARDALLANDLNLEKALTYLQTSTAHSSAKAAKLSTRTTNEGTISVSLLGGKRVGIVHLGCETDFVARNDVFLNTAKGVAGTAAFLDVPSDNGGEGLEMSLDVDPIISWPVQALLSAPLIALPPNTTTTTNTNTSSESPAPLPQTDPITIQQSLLSALGSTGENLRLLRSSSFAAPFPSSPETRFVPGAYAHGGRDDTVGKVGAVTVLGVTSLDESKNMAGLIHGPKGPELEGELLKLARTVARQVVGFPTKCIRRKGVKGGEGLDEGEVLEEQGFMMFGEERKVGEVLEEWGRERGVRVKVVGMRRWAVGDDLGVKEDGEEVGEQPVV